MVHEVYYMTPKVTPEGGKPEVYQMTPAGVHDEGKPEVYFMNPKGQPIPPESTTPGVVTWKLWVSWAEFLSSNTSTSFNTTPGDWSGVAGADRWTAPAGTTMVKIIGKAGYWTKTIGSAYCGSLWFKSVIEAKRAGSGAFYGTTTAATAEWTAQTLTINLDSSRYFVCGYNCTPVALGYMKFEIWIA